MIGNYLSQESVNLFPQQQLPLQNVYHSFDGNEQRIRINQLQLVQHKFIKSLNNLIKHQNSQQKSNISILPYQNSQFYVHFSDEKCLKKMKVYESQESTYATIPRTSIPIMPIQPYSQFYQNYSQDPYMGMQYPLINPILQSQDRFLSAQHQIQQQPSQHFRTQDFQFFGTGDESEPAQQENKNQDHSGNSINLKIKKGKVNDTKNITKNFSKAIITYIIQNKDLGLKHLSQNELDEFINILKDKKNNMTNIKHLRDMWIESTDPKISLFNKAFRIFSHYFLRQQSVSYIYNSRIANTGWHLKYRQNLLRALKEPENFKYIKDI